MIYSLKGNVILKDIGLAVIECGGVGYACRTTNATLSSIQTGSETLLYIYMTVREDSVELFGFATKQELNCFKLLLSVSGVGAKAGLSILSDMTPERFALVVASGDSKTITKTKGIGAKIAQRIILELKDKISKEDIGAGIGNYDFSEVTQENSASSEAISALCVLGYSQSDVTPIVAKLDKSLSSSEMIKQALKVISKGKF